MQKIICFEGIKIPAKLSSRRQAVNLIAHTCSVLDFTNSLELHSRYMSNDVITLCIMP